MKQAVSCLSPEQRRLVAACLDAIVHGNGPYIEDDDESGEREIAQVLMVWRDEDRRRARGQGYWDALM